MAITDKVSEPLHDKDDDEVTAAEEVEAVEGNDGTEDEEEFETILEIIVI